MNEPTVTRVVAEHDGRTIVFQAVPGGFLDSLADAMQEEEMHNASAVLQLTTALMHDHSLSAHELRGCVQQLQWCIADLLRLLQR